MSKIASEITLTVPSELVKRCVGLSIDFGGSLLKVIYRSKDNKKEVESGESKFGHLQLISFPQHEWEKSLEYIKEHADITRDGDAIPVVVSTGLGCTSYGKIICEKLAIQLKQVTEFDCFIFAFNYLASRLPRSELCEPFQNEAAMEVIAALMEQMALMSQMQSQSVTQASVGPDMTSFNPMLLTGQGSAEPTEAPLGEAEDIYPCLLGMLGSGFGFMQINKDKTFKILDASNRGGRAFYGLGSLITDCKDYDELIDLATRGDSKKVDVYTTDVFSKEHAVEGDESMYSMSADAQHGMMIYCFGKCGAPKKKDDFKREDLARAMLKFIVLDVVQTVHLNCQLQGIKRVFLTGSFCNTSLVRQVMTTEFARRNITQFMFSAGAAGPVQFDFLKSGAHLGAIGALINNLDL